MKKGIVVVLLFCLFDNLIAEEIDEDAMFSDVDAVVIETENIETLFKLVEKVHKAIIDVGAERVITELKIDDRRDKNATIESKLNSVQ